MNKLYTHKIFNNHALLILRITHASCIVGSVPLDQMKALLWAQKVINCLLLT